MAEHKDAWDHVREEGTEKVNQAIEVWVSQVHYLNAWTKWVPVVQDQVSNIALHR
jgi:hypothetical protein